MKSRKQLKAVVLAIKKQAGMTLMEIIAALAIIAAVVVGALALFNSAQSSNVSVTMLKDLIAVRGAIQQLYLGQGTYQPAGFTAGDMNLQLNNSKKAPSDLTFINAATGFRTPWGGTFAIAPGPVVGGTVPNFTITMTAVPPEICSQLVTNASNGWSQTTVNGTIVGSTTGAATPYPVTPSRANTACGTAAAGVPVVFTTIN